MSDGSYSISPLTQADGEAVIGIFNHYIANSFAAYREHPLPVAAYGMMMKAVGDHPTGGVRGRDGILAGFGMLRAHKPIAEFAHVAEVIYFLHPDHLRCGLGSKLLAHLEQQGGEHGITNLLASISSRNPVSLAFHEARGFVECGRFRGVGKKHGQVFDTVWMQKML